MVAAPVGEHDGGMTDIPQPSPTGTAPGGTTTSVVDDSLRRLRASGWTRDTERRWFGGVCAGIAARYDVDPVLIRAAAIILALLGGFGVTLYAILWLLMPDRSGRVLAEQALRHGDAAAIVLLVVAGVLLLAGAFSIGDGGNWGIWPLLVAGLAVFIIRARAGNLPQSARPLPLTEGQTVSTSTTPYAAPPAPVAYAPAALPQTGYGAPGYGPPPPAPPMTPITPPPPPRPTRRRPSAWVGLMSLGLLILGFGLGAVLDGPLNFPGGDGVLGAILALALVSGMALWLGVTGRASGFTGFLVLCLLVVSPIVTAASHVDVPTDVRDATFVPTATGPNTYRLGAGDVTLDLRSLPTTRTGAEGPVVVDLEMGFGDITILVPEGLTIELDAGVGAGDISVNDTVDGSASTSRSGPGQTLGATIGEVGSVDATVKVGLAAGNITVERN